MIKIQLTDSNGMFEIPYIEIPLSENSIEGAVDVQTLDNNIRTYFTANKRSWSLSWRRMKKTEWDSLKAIYDRQFSAFKYPLLTITDSTISNVPVRMTMGSKNVRNDCWEVENVQISFRETRQLP